MKLGWRKVFLVIYIFKDGVEKRKKQLEGRREKIK